MCGLDLHGTVGFVIRCQHATEFAQSPRVDVFQVCVCCRLRRGPPPAAFHGARPHGQSWSEGDLFLRECRFQSADFSLLSRLCDRWLCLATMTRLMATLRFVCFIPSSCRRSFSAECLLALPGRLYKLQSAEKLGYSGERPWFRDCARPPRPWSPSSLHAVRPLIHWGL